MAKSSGKTAANETETANLNQDPTNGGVNIQPVDGIAPETSDTTVNSGITSLGAGGVNIQPVDGMAPKSSDTTVNSGITSLCAGTNVISLTEQLRTASEAVKYLATLIASLESGAGIASNVISLTDQVPAAVEALKCLVTLISTLESVAGIVSNVISLTDQLPAVVEALKCLGTFITTLESVASTVSLNDQAPTVEADRIQGDVQAPTVEADRIQGDVQAEAALEPAGAQPLTPAQQIALVKRKQAEEKALKQLRKKEKRSASSLPPSVAQDKNTRAMKLKSIKQQEVIDQSQRNRKPAKK